MFDFSIQRTVTSLVRKPWLLKDHFKERGYLAGRRVEMGKALLLGIPVTR